MLRKDTAPLLRGLWTLLLTLDNQWISSFNSQGYLEFSGQAWFLRLYLGDVIYSRNRTSPDWKDTVLGSAGIELIFTRSWLGWPKQLVKWDILYPVMSCSVFKWGVGWRRGFCYSGASWAPGGENSACCICFLSALLIVVFFSLCHYVKLILLPIPPGRGKE